MGTVFLRCPEAQTHPAWADALEDLEPENTVPTRAFTGRLARAIATDFVVAAAAADAPAPAPYPVQRGLTAAMKEAGAAAARPPPHAGVGGAGGRDGAAGARPATLVAALWRDAQRHL